MNTHLVAVARFAFHSWISPEIFLALITSVPSKTRFAVALSCVEIAFSSCRSNWITSAVDTSLPAGNLPMVGDATLAVVALHVGEAVARA